MNRYLYYVIYHSVFFSHNCEKRINNHIVFKSIGSWMLKDFFFKLLIDF